MVSLKAEEIKKAVAEMCVEANTGLSPDMSAALEKAAREETNQRGRWVLSQLQKNLAIAGETGIPICQDTGMAVVFLELGQEVHIEGGGLYDAINEGVREGYVKGKLRCSVVGDPIERVNTGDNTPPVIYTDIVPGGTLKITLAPKGFGSENMSALKMLKPADGVEGVKRFVLETVEKAGANPCPPIIVGVGIGGSFDKAAYLAKHALLRPLDKPNRDEYYAALEKELLDKINALGIGPQGFGGKTTALAVLIESMPTHVAGLPVAVNISCHATRRKSASL